jgi:hypothetical protein
VACCSRALTAAGCGAALRASRARRSGSATRLSSCCRGCRLQDACSGLEAGALLCPRLQGAETLMRCVRMGGGQRWTVGVHTVGVHTVGVHTVGVRTLGVQRVGLQTYSGSADTRRAESGIADTGRAASETETETERVGLLWETNLQLRNCPDWVPACELVWMPVALPRVTSPSQAEAPLTVIVYSCRCCDCATQHSRNNHHRTAHGRRTP